MNRIGDGDLQLSFGRLSTQKGYWARCSICQISAITSVCQVKHSRRSLLSRPLASTPSATGTGESQMEQYAAD